MRRWLWGLLIVLAVVLCMTLGRYVSAIESQSKTDEAKPADVIVVLGAAEYNGRPSPVLRARLDHALKLWREGYARQIMTTGGAGGDARYTEAMVGRDYLVQSGVPSELIILEDDSETTAQTITMVSEIMRRMQLRSAILVSDGYHIFRAKRMLENSGVRVYGSPRAAREESGWRLHWLALRQSCGYLLWRIGITI